MKKKDKHGVFMLLLLKVAVMTGHMKCLNDNDDLQYTDLSLEAQNL